MAGRRSGRKEISQTSKLNSLPVSVPLIGLGEYMDRLSKLVQSLIGITEDDLSTFNIKQLKLIILGARDREECKIGERDEVLKKELQTNLGPISDTLRTLSLKIEQNTNSLKDNSSVVKSYAEVVSSSSPSSCEQLRQIIKDEEAVKCKIRLEHEDKRRRETNIMVYGLTERDKEEEINEFTRVTEELGIQAKVLDTVRIGKVMDQGRPRPLRIKLESKYWRQKIISNAPKLKLIPRFSKVYIRPDLTPNERILRSDLHAQLKERIAEQPEIRWTIKAGQVRESASC